MTLVWECSMNAHCIIEHHQGYLYLFTNVDNQGQQIDHHYLLQSTVDPSCYPRKWEVSIPLYCFYQTLRFSWSWALFIFHDLLQNVFANEQELIIEDVDFCHSHLVLIIREKRKYGLCSISLPLSSPKVINVFSMQYFWVQADVSTICLCVPTTHFTLLKSHWISFENYVFMLFIVCLVITDVTGIGMWSLLCWVYRYQLVLCCVYWLISWDIVSKNSIHSTCLFQIMYPKYCLDLTMTIFLQPCALQLHHQWYVKISRYAGLSWFYAIFFIWSNPANFFPYFFISEVSNWVDKDFILINYLMSYH